jgi:hypothetical protein
VIAAGLLFRLVRRRALSVVVLLVAALAAGLAVAASSRADVVINELRGSGTTPDDDFIELLNRGPAPVNMVGWRLDARDGTNSAVGSVTLPAQTIAPRGTLLVTAPGYSLGGLAGSDDALSGLPTGELPAEGSVALIDPTNATQDSVRFAAGTTFGEGGPVGTFAPGGQYAFVRKANRTGTGDAYGLPTDTNDNAADFALVVPPGATSSAGSALPSIEGVPGPENLRSAPLANAALQVGRLDPTVAGNEAPNREITDPDGGGPLPQTLYLRRTVTNISGVDLARLQFRVTAITTTRSDPKAGQGIVHLDSSDNTTVGGKAITPVSLERSAQTPLPGGGGLNAVVSVPSVTPTAPLAPGTSINVEFALRIAQAGAFQVILNTEAGRVNDAPTDISLSNSSVPENQPSGTTVGTLSTTDPDPNDSHTYSLVAGPGDSDNGAFQISGDTLKTNQSFDFETKSSYSIRVRSTDDGAPAKSTEKVFTITVGDANEAPTDISLSNAKVDENQPSGTTVGTLSSTDQDVGDTHTYSLVAGAGDTDNGAFQITGDTLKTNQSFDFEAKSSYSIRVRSTDSGGQSTEKQFTITITNVNDPPTDIALSNANVDENKPSGTDVGTFSTTDQDAGDTHTYSLVAGAGSTDNGAFQVTGDTLRTNQSFNFEAKSSYSIRVRSTDSGNQSTEKQFTITINDVNDPPVAGADSSSTVGNTLLAWGGTASVPAGQAGKDVLSGNVLSNDTDEDAGQTLSMDVANSSTTTPNGGSVTWFADGSFRYVPAVNFTGSDTLTYKVTDGQTSVNGTVAISVANKVWYVKNNQAAGGNGRSTEPFDTLAEAQNASGTNDTIYVFKGDGTMTGQNAGIALKSNQRLLGEPVDLVVGGDTLFTGNPSNRPSMSGNPGVKLATGSTVQGLDIAGSGGPAVCAGTAAPCSAGAVANGSTVSDVNLTGNAGGFNLAGGSGTFNLSKFSVNTTGGTGLFANNAGTLTVPSPPPTTVNSTGGAAVDIQSTGGPVALDSASSTNSPGDGINLDSNGSGTFSAAAGSITGAAAIDVDINAGNGDVTYAGTLGNSTGATADITGRTGGSITLSGNINDTNDAGGGITMSGNTGGSTTFSGTTKTLNTGTATAFSSTGSGHTINLTGGGLDIDTTSGNGLSATGGGTINVTTGANPNTIDTTTGTALNVSGTNFGASGATFQSVSSNNAPSGIVLNGTGGSGGLAVTGNNAAGTGGTIRNSTGAGVILMSTTSPSLSWMNIQNNGDDGIHGESVSGLTLNRSNVISNGNSTSDDGIQLGLESGSTTGVTGTVSLTNSSVSGNAHNNVHVRDTSGTISSLTVTGDTFSNLNDTTGANSFLFEGSGTSTLNSATMSGNTFGNNSPQRALEVQAHDTASVSGFVVQNNSFSDSGIHASFTQDGSANFAFKFLSNTMVNPQTPTPNSTFGQYLQAVNVFSSSQSTGGSIQGRISGNTIGTAGVPNSGSATGSGIRTFIQGKTQGTLLLDGNTIREVGTQGGNRGVDAQFVGVPTPCSGSVPTSSITFTNNNIDTQAPASTFPLAAAYISGDNQGCGGITQADIHGNTVPTAGTFDFPTFDGNGGQLIFDEVGSGDARLVGNAGTAQTQLANTNTGKVYAPSGVQMIPGPIATPP